MPLEEEVILVFDIDETPAVQSIKDLRAANTELRKSRDGVNIATKEGQELVQKLNVAIDKNNSTIKANSSALEKQRQNVGNYSESIKDAAGELNLFGVNVGAATTNLTKFINPATAAAGALTALAGLYLKSAAGAEDFAKAQSGLNALIDEFSNQVGNAGDVGFLEGLVEFTSKIAIAFTSNTKELANQRNINLDIARFQLEKLRNLEEEAIIAAQIRKDSERDAENARRARDDDKKTNEERLAAAQEVQNALNRNEQTRVKVLQAQVRAIYLYGEAVGSIDQGGRQQALTGDINFDLIKSREIRIQLRKIQAEQADIQEEINGKLTENITATNNLLKVETKITDEKIKQANTQNDISAGGSGITAGSENTDFVAMAKNAELTLYEDTEDGKREQLQKTADLERLFNDARIAQASYYADALMSLSSIAGEQNEVFKLAASAQTIISTYTGATNAFASLSSIPFVGPALGAAAAASAIAAGLANLAQINGVQFAEGGYTGHGSKYQPAGVVHAGEVVWSQRDVAAVGGPMIANSMRPTAALKGYADGGFVTNTNSLQSQQNMIMMNMIRQLPAPVVGVREITRVQNQVAVKQNLAKV